MDRYLANLERIDVLTAEITYWQANNAKGVGNPQGLICQLQDEKDILFSDNFHIMWEMVFD
jgi:hypothetical protein